MVLAVAFFSRRDLEELWIAFGAKNATLPSMRLLHLVFHAFTGCDQTSTFAGRRKNTAWNTWMAYQEGTDVFRSLSKTPTADKLSNAIPTSQRFVILMYDRTSANEDVNDARKTMFTPKGRSLENIPPTSTALVQHTKRAVYQGGHCWGRCVQSSPVLPSPSD